MMRSRAGIGRLGIAAIRLAICWPLLGVAYRAAADDKFAIRLNGPVQELSRKTVRIGGRSITYLRIAPPEFVPINLPTTAVTLPTEVELAREKARQSKTFEFVSLSATVFVEGEKVVSELVWWNGERRLRAVSNVDFRVLADLVEFETASHVFGWFPMTFELSGQPEDALSAKLPPVEAGADFVFLGPPEDAAANEVTLGALDALHAYYELNERALAEAFQKRRAAENAAEERRLREPVPVAPDTIMYFWRKNVEGAP